MKARLRTEQLLLESVKEVLLEGPEGETFEEAASRATQRCIEAWVKALYAVPQVSKKELESEIDEMVRSTIRKKTYGITSLEEYRRARRKRVGSP